MPTRPKTWISAFGFIFLMVTAFAWASPVPDTGQNAEVNSWIVTQNGNLLQIAYGKGTNFPQYAVLDLTSGYLRLVPDQSSGWGTSVIINPVFWSGGLNYQSIPISTTHTTNGSNLDISYTGSQTTPTTGTLNIQGLLSISPPSGNYISASVSLTTSGNITIDNRPNEAFKLVMLSSMYDSTTVWDAKSAFACSQTYTIPIPPAGGGNWIVSPAVNCREFGINGGTSTWKKAAPTIQISLGQSEQITGWVAQDNNPNNDNVALWAASDTVLKSFNYTITAISTANPATPTLNVKANGLHGDVSFFSGTHVSITASLDPGDQNGKTADWWVAESTPGGLYTMTTSGWLPGLNPLIQYPLFGLSPVEIFTGLLAVGDYAFYFAVDMNPNGIFDSPYYYDYVQVHIVN
jgi:hypothetical protein